MEFKEEKMEGIAFTILEFIDNFDINRVNKRTLLVLGLWTGTLLGATIIHTIRR